MSYININYRLKSFKKTSLSDWDRLRCKWGAKQTFYPLTSVRVVRHCDAVADSIPTECTQRICRLKSLVSHRWTRLFDSV
jgi:hypothetical protein